MPLQSRRLQWTVWDDVYNPIRRVSRSGWPMNTHNPSTVSRHDVGLIAQRRPKDTPPSFLSIKISARKRLLHVVRAPRTSIFSTLEVLLSMFHVLQDFDVVEDANGESWRRGQANDDLIRHHPWIRILFTVALPTTEPGKWPWVIHFAVFQA